MRGHNLWAVVCDCCRGDEHIAGYGRFAGGEHVAGADHVDAGDTIGRWQVHRAGDQGYLGAGFDSRFGQGEAHFPRAVVGDVAHRVDVFLGRASSDQHVLAGQRLALECLGGAPGQVSGFEHAAQAHVATGLAAGGRAEHLDITALQQLQVGLGGRVAPHRLVHRRGHGHSGVGSQYQGGQQIVGNTLCQAREQVGGGWGNQHQVGPLGQFDMAHRRFGSRVQ
ncbi:hypothetical protein D3C81_1009700 [compost metagenome]